MMTARRLLFLLVGMAGAAVLWFPGQAYSIERFDCPNWPSPSAGLPYQALVLLGVVLSSVAWLGLVRERAQKLSHVLWMGAALHAVALIVPCFLSQDPLFYAAIGRAIAKYHANPYTLRIGDALPAGDPFLAAMPGVWKLGTSAYSPGFHGVAWLVARLAGDDLHLALKLFQVVGLLSMLDTAAIAGVAARDGRAAALVVFSPLSVIEGTIGAHNDGLVAVGVALFALSLARRRPVLWLGAAIGGLAIKASAVLLAAMYSMTLAFTFARERLRGRRGVYLALALVAAAAIALALPLLRRVTQVIGSPDQIDFCTSFSAECAMRFGLRWIFQLGMAAWLVGIAFRIAGLGLLVWTAWRASRDGNVLGWAAAMLFAYFLYFSGQSECWYWLPLLPLLSFADPRLQPAMLAVCIVSVATYPVHLMFTCGDVQGMPMWQRILGNAAEEISLNVPTTWLLWRGLSRRVDV